MSGRLEGGMDERSEGERKDKIEKKSKNYKGKRKWKRVGPKIKHI